MVSNLAKSSARCHDKENAWKYTSKEIHFPKYALKNTTNLAEASSMTNAMQEATKRDQERERPYSAPALHSKIFFREGV